MENSLNLEAALRKNWLDTVLHRKLYRFTRSRCLYNHADKSRALCRIVFMAGKLRLVQRQFIPDTGSGI
jgi:hypothetical protein